MVIAEKYLASPNVNDTVSHEKDAPIAPILEPDEDLEATYGVNEKALLRKLDLKLLPALTLLYLLSFLDRSNGNYYNCPDKY